VQSSKCDRVALHTAKVIRIPEYHYTTHLLNIPRKELQQQYI